VNTPPSSHSIPDLICLSHLRWRFVFQRPQHLLTRCARDRRVFYVEEPVFESAETVPRLDVQNCDGVHVAVPYLPSGLDEAEVAANQCQLLNQLIARERITRYVLWYYTPMALACTEHLQPLAVVYDCMDELSAFKHAPPALKRREAQLLAKADLVFTGGRSLYEAKRHAHPHVYAFPSSVDAKHFARARQIQSDPPDQAPLASPRLGFFGVVDERFDVDLLGGIAAAKPAWQFVILGPIVKIDPASLPAAPNIHYLGAKSYDDLPRYISGWDVALLLFARNEATRYISPTKTPEYMAAGKPVVSTSIRDVVVPYGQRGLVRIADQVPEFIAACEAALVEDPVERTRQADAFLRQTSWDGTWAQMRGLSTASLLLPMASSVRQRVPEGVRCSIIW